MANRLFHATAWTPTATADATNLANGTYMALQGGSSTQSINLKEVYVTGQATTSTPTYLQMARDSTVGASLTALAAPNGDGPMNPATAALAAPPASFVAATTNPQRSNSAAQGRLELGLNAFGGVAKWNPYTPDMAFGILGNTASLGEISLSAFTGGTPGAVNCHWIYEPL